MNLLIIRPAALGDTLMLVPALADLQGKAAVTLAGRSPGLHFLRCYTVGLMDMDLHGWHRLFSIYPKAEALPELSPDIVVGFLKSRDRIVMNNLKQLYPAAQIRVFPSYPHEGERIHTASHLAQCLKQAGLPIDPDNCMQRALKCPLLGKHLSGKTAREIILHPGSGSPKKNYSPGFWAELFKEMFEDPALEDYSLFLLLGPAEERLYELFSNKRVIEKNRIISSPENESLKKMLEGAALFIGHDSGITHLSAMLGTPTLALFRENNTPQWSPLGPRVKIIQKKEESLGIIKNISCSARLLLGLNA